MLAPSGGALCGAGRAPGKRRRNGTRLIGFGAAAGFLALTTVRLTRRLLLPAFLPVPLPDFFFAMARSRLPACGAHFHMNHFASIVVSARGETCSSASAASS